MGFSLNLIPLWGIRSSEEYTLRGYVVNKFPTVNVRRQPAEGYSISSGSSASSANFAFIVGFFHVSLRMVSPSALSLARRS